MPASGAITPGAMATLSSASSSTRTAIGERGQSNSPPDPSERALSSFTSTATAEGAGGRVTCTPEAARRAISSSPRRMRAGFQRSERRSTFIQTPSPSATVRPTISVAPSSLSSTPSAFSSSSPGTEICSSAKSTRLFFNPRNDRSAAAGKAKRSAHMRISRRIRTPARWRCRTRRNRRHRAR